MTRAKGGGDRRDGPIHANSAVPETVDIGPRIDAGLREIASALPERINADPERVEQGLARLVLTLVELIRKVLEHQAVRRMDGGNLSDEEVERLGLALMRLDERMQELKATFGLTDDDLQIDLGPLGNIR